MQDDVRLYRFPLSLYELPQDKECGTVISLIRSIPGVAGAAYKGKHVVSVTSTDWPGTEPRIRELVRASEFAAEFVGKPKSTAVLDSEVVRRHKIGHCSAAIAHDLKIPRARVARVVKAWC